MNERIGGRECVRNSRLKMLAAMARRSGNMTAGWRTLWRRYSVYLYVHGSRADVDLNIQDTIVRRN